MDNITERKGLDVCNELTQKLLERLQKLFLY